MIVSNANFQTNSGYLGIFMLRNTKALHCVPLENIGIFVLPKII